MLYSKYLVYDTGSLITAVIFHASIPHDEMAESVQPNTTGKLRNEDWILGAGFLQIDHDPKSQYLLVTAYGEATSLGIKADPKRDEKIIRRTLGLKDPIEEKRNEALQKSHC